MVLIHGESCVFGSPKPCRWAGCPSLCIGGKPTFYWCLLSPRKRKVSHCILILVGDQRLPAHQPAHKINRKPHHALPLSIIVQNIHTARSTAMETYDKQTKKKYTHLRRTRASTTAKFISGFCTHARTHIHRASQTHSFQVLLECFVRIFIRT